MWPGEVAGRVLWQPGVAESEPRGCTRRGPMNEADENPAQMGSKGSTWLTRAVGRDLR